MSERQDLPAGSFSTWLERTRFALAKENATDVPCGECTACCRSSLFIHIRPEETETITHIPRALLFPAPGLPKGTMVLGYDEKGDCPMLIEGRCSIYEHRPLTCRTYDCRIFSAAGIAPDEDDKALITQRIRRWNFTYPTERDHYQYAAVQAAAQFLQQRAECFPAGVVPNNRTQLALLAIKVYDVFLKQEESGKTGRVASDLPVAKAVMEAKEKFDSGRDRETATTILTQKP